ncbi:MAG: hypothetical protein ACXWLK_00265 [Rhizomicrobium sp.]
MSPSEREHVAKEVAAAFQAGAADRVVLEHLDGHGSVELRIVVLTE